MKQVLGILCLIIFGVLAGLGLSEGLVRYFYPHARDAVIPDHLFVIDDDLGWKLAPSRSSLHHSRYFDAPYAINSLGFRDRPRTKAGNPNARRILLYGDSLIFGWGLKHEERFSDLIEAGNSALEILNLGVPGYGLDQEIILHEKEGGSLNANEVIFFVSTSTLWRIHTGYIYAKYKPMFAQQEDGRLALVPIPKGRNAALRFLYEIFSPFYLPYFLQTQVAVVQESMRLRAAGVRNVGTRTIESTRLVDELTKGMLRMARNTARRQHQEMAILVANLSQADRTELRAFCREIDAAYLRISPEISATMTTDENSDLIFGKYDKHWNAKANRLIAGQLLPQMKRDRDDRK